MIPSLSQVSIVLFAAAGIITALLWSEVQVLKAESREKDAAIESLAAANQEAAIELNTHIELALRATKRHQEAAQQIAALRIDLNKALQDDSCAGKPVPGVIADSLRQQSGH